MHKELERICQDFVRGRGAVAEGGSVAGRVLGSRVRKRGRLDRVRYAGSLCPALPGHASLLTSWCVHEGGRGAACACARCAARRVAGAAEAVLAQRLTPPLPCAALTRLRPCPLRRPCGRPTPAAPSAPRRRAGRCRTANVQLSSTSSRRHPSAPVRCARPQRERAAAGSVACMRSTASAGPSARLARVSAAQRLRIRGPVGCGCLRPLSSPTQRAWH